MNLPVPYHSLLPSLHPLLTLLCPPPSISCPSLVPISSLSCPYLVPVLSLTCYPSPPETWSSTLKPWVLLRIFAIFWVKNQHFTARHWMLTITNLDGDRDDLEDGDDLEDRYDNEDGPILCCHFHCHVTVVYLRN